MLYGLIQSLNYQVTSGLFVYSIVVVDNDVSQSARSIVDIQKYRNSIQIDYFVEPRQSIPLARNKAIENSKGNYIAFIDDDEVPTDKWLLNLYNSCLKYRADGVLGPVKPIFQKKPPNWIIKGKLFERPSYKTGKILEWPNTRTGNVLLRKEIFHKSFNLFNSKFRHSEDQEFFKRMTQQGYVFIWCEEALLYEIETIDRFKKIYFIRRALLRGNISLRLRSKKSFLILKSLIAFLIYTLSLPILLFLSKHLFFRYSVKDCDHLGRLLSAIGVDMQKYFT